jgi:hypothetical protein
VELKVRPAGLGHPTRLVELVTGVAEAACLANSVVHCGGCRTASSIAGQCTHHTVCDTCWTPSAVQSLWATASACCCHRDTHWQ